MKILHFILIFCMIAPIGVFSQEIDKAVKKHVIDVSDVVKSIGKSVEDMSEDMDAFNLDRIHPHLKRIYGYYDSLRIWADQLSGSAKEAAIKKIDKYQKKTEQIHRYFDAGEIVTSSSKLERLKRAVPKLKKYLTSLK